MLHRSFVPWSPRETGNAPPFWFTQSCSLHHHSIYHLCILFTYHFPTCNMTKLESWLICLLVYCWKGSLAVSAQKVDCMSDPDSIWLLGWSLPSSSISKVFCPSFTCPSASAPSTPFILPTPQPLVTHRMFKCIQFLYLPPVLLSMGRS